MGAVVVVGAGAEVGRRGIKAGWVEGLSVGEEDGELVSWEEETGGIGGAVTVVDCVVATVKVWVEPMIGSMEDAEEEEDGGRGEAVAVGITVTVAVVFTAPVEKLFCGLKSITLLKETLTSYTHAGGAGDATAASLGAGTAFIAVLTAVKLVRATLPLAATTHVPVAGVRD